MLPTRPNPQSLSSVDDSNRRAPSSQAIDLQRRVRQFLSAANYPALRHIGVDVQHDSVILSGVVTTFYAKQMACEFARRVAGVVRVVNLIDVRVPPTSDDGRFDLEHAG